MNRVLTMIYGVAAYFLFFAIFLYLFAFAGDILVPKSVSVGSVVDPSLGTILFNLLLITFFGLQHSVMARPSFKAWWTRIVPVSVERSTYVLITNLIFILIFLAWKPMPKEIWNVSGTILAPVLWVLFAMGAGIALLSSFMINHFDLFGLRQTYLHMMNKPYTSVPFQVKGFYRFVRNPLMLGFLIAFWAAPVLTVGRLVFAAGMTFYIFIGIYFEERTIKRHLGENYHRYYDETSMILPIPKKNHKKNCQKNEPNLSLLGY